MASIDEIPQFEVLTSVGRVCEHCKYDLPEEGFLICRLFGTKPAEVINNDECPYFTARMKNKGEE